jgi:hypothetical protein
MMMVGRAENQFDKNQGFEVRCGEAVEPLRPREAHFQWARPANAELQASWEGRLRRSVNRHNMHADLADRGQLSFDRRGFLAGVAASTTGLLSVQASAQEAPTADLAAALARFRTSTVITLSTRWCRFS